MRHHGATWTEIGQALDLPPATIRYELSQDNPLRDFAVWYAKTLPLAVPA